LKSSAKNISLNSYDDIFSTEETREDAKREKVTDMPLSELYPFTDHPFQVRDDDAMKETVESIKKYGVLVPAIVRPRADGGYELISGHRRKHACELAGLPTMPVIVRDLDDDAATIIMVDSNIQRENILPSERAKAYKMKLDAIRRQAGRPSKENCAQVGHNFDGKRSVQVVADQAGESKTQVQRFIRLNELSPQLQQMVDDKKIAMTPAVELSYLKPEEQTLLLDTIESEQATPSLSQAQRLKNFSQEGHLNEDSMLAIMSEEKKPEKNDLTIKADKLQKYFPKSYTPQQMEQVIIRLLDGWQKKRQRDQER
jgi:ParB family chromosome partitioning protein